MINTITVSVKTFLAAAFYIKKKKKTRIHFAGNKRLSEGTYADSSFAFESEFCLKAEVNLKPCFYEEATREAFRQ